MSKCFSGNPKNAPCVAHTAHNAFATKQWQKRGSIVSLLCLQKEHWEVSDIPNKQGLFVWIKHII